MKVDVVIDGAFGDCGKAKVTNSLLMKNKYTHCLRFSGGANAGHTLYIDGKKFVTHIIPIGALHGVTSIVGPGCVLNERTFFEELNEIAKEIPDVVNHVKISYNTHIVTEEHLDEELKESKIGTTRRGIGPAFRDKYSRVGVRAEDISSLREFIIDPYEVLHSSPDNYILGEGAQGLGLDIDFGDYPYVTSSNCGVGAVVNSGIPHTAINDVWMTEKAYETYVGTKEFEDYSDPMLEKIGDLGHEYGATTGRRRQVNYLDINRLKRSVMVADPTHIVFNKIDILREAKSFRVKQGGVVIDLVNEDSFRLHVEHAVGLHRNVIFSDNPYDI